MNQSVENAVQYLESIPEEARLLHTAVYEMRWRDMDAFGHLNNANYFAFFEQARFDWFQTIGASFGAVLANISCTFLIPLVYPATLEVRLYAGKPGRSSVDSFYELRSNTHAEQLCAIGHGTLVWYDHDSLCSTEIPERIRTLLEG